LLRTGRQPRAGAKAEAAAAAVTATTRDGIMQRTSASSGRAAFSLKQNRSSENSSAHVENSPFR
jgi:hypothetical protein